MTLDINKLSNADVFDRSGDKIGSVGSVYVSDDSGRPSFVTVKTGLFGTKETFVPVDQATETADGLQVPFEKAFVKDAPNVDADGHISEAEEDEIYRYYAGHVGTGRDGARDGVAAGAAAGTAGAAAGTAGRRDAERDGVVTDDRNREAVAGTDERRLADDRNAAAQHDANADGSMVRREEELTVGKERVETGRVRLRKHVVTEHKTVSVPVEREEVEVVREPIANGEGTTGGRLSDDEQSVSLSGERVVVNKEVVDKERVGLQTNTVQGEEQVEADLRREEVDVEREGGRVADGRDDALGEDRR